MIDAPWFEATRYYVALMVWLTLPAAIAYWLVIHPAARFWRRVGPPATFATVALVMLAVGWLCWLVREPVMASKFPFHWSLALLGVVLYALSVVIEIKCRRHLKLHILVGVPEVSGGDPGRLLTEGIYAHCRNPRYLDLLIGLAGWSLILNYGVMYAVTLGSVVGLYAIILLEERELVQRFGAPYEEYLGSVPRLVPRSWAFLRS